MKPTSFHFSSIDGKPIFVNKWMPGEGVRGIVQIAHGMCEHSERYCDFAAALVDAGYAVYANDHRGHGKTAGALENLGYFADENGWELVVDDMYELTQISKKENPTLPIFLFGHSMGSFLSRRYIQKYGSEISGVILSGTGADPGLLSAIGIGIAKWEIKKKGRKARSALLTQLTFGNYNKQFRPQRTEHDWLSRDEKEVDKYIADPYCGAVVTAGFFHDMVTGIKLLDRPEQLGNVPKDLPILLFSGEKDPVGNNTKGVRKVFRNFQKAGIQDVSCKFYPDGRHEMLNEINKEEVYCDVMDWLNKRVGVANLQK